MEYTERLVALAICCVSLGVLVGYWWGCATGKADVYQKWASSPQSIKTQLHGEVKLTPEQSERICKELLKVLEKYAKNNNPT